MSAHDHALEHDHTLDHGHAHVHGFDSFLDRWWQAFVIGFGAIFVWILTHYYPTAN